MFYLLDSFLTRIGGQIDFKSVGRMNQVLQIRNLRYQICILDPTTEPMKGLNITIHFLKFCYQLILLNFLVVGALIR
jgi:hypothetical protein